ncbi:MAG: hypothetical protein AAF490_29690, partial [Chloroflexota bacterium]
VQQFRDDRDAALDSYNQALSRFNDIGSLLGQANLKQSLGKLYVQSGNEEAVKRGFKTLDEAMTLYQSIGDKVGQANIYIFLSQMLASTGQMPQAVELGEKGLELALQFAPNHPSTAGLKAYVAQLKEMNHNQSK